MLNYRLLTKYAESLDESNVLNDYPRPQFRRDSYFCLNGIWKYAISKSKDLNQEFKNDVLVPFPIESCLSKVMKTLNKREYLIYRKEFSLPKNFIKQKTFINFGAVDQITEVILNGKILGHHEGGYLPFSFDISSIVNQENNVLYVIVQDDNSYLYPTGKQRKKRGGIFYTPTSGIWQSIWLESTGKETIEGIKLNPDIDNNLLNLEIKTAAKNINVVIKDKNKEIYNASTSVKTLSIDIPNAHLWSPEHPYLYDIEISSKDDKIASYFAMRKVSIINNKICLNNKPYFINGVLDQGYFSDGIYTPASYKAYEDDILSMKELGFNALRKHIKIEPMIFYHLCDKLGMLVMQDMVNVGEYKFFRHTALPFLGLRNIKANDLNTTQRNNYIAHTKETIEYLYNVPSIVYYTIFNEGWGEFKPDDLYDLVTSLDHTRIIDATSGWFFGKKSDVESYHIYLKPIKIEKKNRPIIVSEFGGFCHKEKDHSFLTSDKNGTAYKMYETLDEYEKTFINVFENEIIPAKTNGLCGLVYTQLSDVEDECNGIYTYDRKICKLNKEKIKDLMFKVKETN